MPDGDTVAAVSSIEDQKMGMSAAAIILAAGKSTRMRSKLPKPLHPICGLAMTGHVIKACKLAGITRVIVVVGHEAEKVMDGLGNEVEYALQSQQGGTGDAVRAAFPLLGDWIGPLLVLAGDVPLLTGATLSNLIERQTNQDAIVTMLTAELENPVGYGRILRDDNGQVVGIVEERDADSLQRSICEVNPSIYVYDSAALWPALDALKPDNAQGEYYLTDTIRYLAQSGARIDAIRVDDSVDVTGVNTRVELANVTSIMQRRLLDKLMLDGVTIIDPNTTYVDVDVEIGQDTIIEPNTIVLKGTQIGEDCILGPFSRIERSVLGNGVQVTASQVLNSIVANDVKIGPYAHIRPGSNLGANVKIGNFVEVKNSYLAPDVHASHLSYLGDADIGEGTNIGAGSITCNYDGYNKYRTTIGKGVFIGSHSALVAPIRIGDGAFVAAASAITENVPDDALAIARARQEIKLGWASTYHAKKKEGKVKSDLNSQLESPLEARDAN